MFIFFILYIFYFYLSKNNSTKRWDNILGRVGCYWYIDYKLNAPTKDHIALNPDITPAALLIGSILFIKEEICQQEK